MKTKLTPIFLILANIALAQNVIISKTYEPTVPVNSSALLTLNSDNQGLLLPRISNKETSVAYPPAGLVVYDNDNSKISYYNGNQWSNLGESTLTPRFPNSKGFQPPYYTAWPAQEQYLFTVPAGITQLWVEAWGGGKSGDSYPSGLQPSSTMWGGSGGDYASFTLGVSPGQLLAFDVSKGGNSSMSPNYLPTQIVPNDGMSGLILVSAGGENGVQIPPNTTASLIKFVGGQKGLPDELFPTMYITQGPMNASYQNPLSKYSGANGGSSYPNQPGGKGAAVIYNGSTFYSVRGGTSVGSSPGGGGGAFSGGNSMGGPGLVIVHW